MEITFEEYARKLKEISDEKYRKSLNNEESIKVAKAISGQLSKISNEDKTLLHKDTVNIRLFGKNLSSFIALSDENKETIGSFFDEMTIDLADGSYFDFCCFYTTKSFSIDIDYYPAR